MTVAPTSPKVKACPPSLRRPQDGGLTLELNPRMVIGSFHPEGQFNTIEDVVAYQGFLAQAPSGEECLQAALDHAREHLPALPVSNSSSSQEIPLPTCMICLSSRWSARTGERTISLTDSAVLSCGHGPFHRRCLLRMFSSGNPGSMLCPICRCSVEPHWQGGVRDGTAPQFVLVRGQRSVIAQAFTGLPRDGNEEEVASGSAGWGCS